MRKSAFAICEDHNAYIGYTSGRLWNGWATPYFTYEEAQRLQADFNQNAESPMLYDVTKDEFRVKYDGDDEPYIWKGEDIQTVDGIKHLYGIGAYSHIWDELDDDIKRSLAQQICEFLDDYFPAELIEKFTNLRTFVKAYEIMYNDAYGVDERYTKLTEVLSI